MLMRAFGSDEKRSASSVSRASVCLVVLCAPGVAFAQEAASGEEARQIGAMAAIILTLTGALVVVLRYPAVARVATTPWVRRILVLLSVELLLCLIAFIDCDRHLPPEPYRWSAQAKPLLTPLYAQYQDVNSRIAFWVMFLIFGTPAAIVLNWTIFYVLSKYPTSLYAQLHTGWIVLFGLAVPFAPLVLGYNYARLVWLTMRISSLVP